MSDFYENYSVLDTLGVGGYGEVKLIQDNLSKVKRAGKFMKIIEEKGLKSEKQKVMILNEIKILRKIDHPNVVKIYEVYELDNEICIVLEYIEGERLLDYVTRTKRLYEKETATIMKHLILTLSYLESLDIIHRDIKSENVMLIREKTGKLSIKLIDFGLSTFHSKRDIIKRCGTPGYVAPEILNNEPYDFRVDIYSIGIILFICLTGKSPFAANDYRDLLEKNRKGFVNYRGRHWSSLSSDAKNLIQRLLDPLQASRMTLEEAISHNWIRDNLSPEEKKYLSEYVFHVVKMNVPEEKRISNVPTTSTGHFSKAIRSRT